MAHYILLKTATQAIEARCRRNGHTVKFRRFYKVLLWLQWMRLLLDGSKGGKKLPHPLLFSKGRLQGSSFSLILALSLRFIYLWNFKKMYTLFGELEISICLERSMQHSWQHQFQRIWCQLVSNPALHVCNWILQEVQLNKTKYGSV